MPKIINKSPDGRVRVINQLEGPSKTDSSFAKDTDINNIMYKYRAIGVTYNKLPGPGKGVYGDFTKIKDYKSAMESVIQTQNQFMALPSHIRNRFQNDPVQLIKFVEDPKNYDEGVELGLFKPKPKQTELPQTSVDPK